jgi:Ca2+-binding EF-hand superfamily protein
MTCVDRAKFMTLEKVEALFSELDTDGNQMISFDEIKQILGQADERISLEALKEAFMEVDTNRNGEISFTQFKQFIENLLN